MANTPLAGYPQPIGEKYMTAFDHTGPTSYTQCTVGTTPTGGDVINASDLGLGGFDNIIEASRDTTGQIAVTPILNLGGSGNAVPSIILLYIAQATATLGGQAQTSGSQIVAGTNLSTFKFRINAIMV